MKTSTIVSIVHALIYLLVLIGTSIHCFIETKKGQLQKQKQKLNHPDLESLVFPESMAETREEKEDEAEEIYLLPREINDSKTSEITNEFEFVESQRQKSKVLDAQTMFNKIYSDEDNEIEEKEAGVFITNHTPKPQRK